MADQPAKPKGSGCPLCEGKKRRQSGKESSSLGNQRNSTWEKGGKKLKFWADVEKGTSTFDLGEKEKKQRGSIKGESNVLEGKRTHDAPAGNFSKVGKKRLFKAVLRCGKVCSPGRGGEGIPLGKNVPDRFWKKGWKAESPEGSRVNKHRAKKNTHPPQQKQNQGPLGIPN